MIAPDGSKHDKQTLLKSIFLPDGMIIASSLNPLSMDRNSHVQGKSRHGANKKDEGTSVTRSFNLAKGYNPNGSFEDTNEGTDVYMFDDALVMLIKAKESPNTPAMIRLAVGRAKAFGRLGEQAKESSMQIDELSKYHITVAIDDCIEVQSSDDKAAFQATGKSLVVLPKVPASSVIFVKPRMEIFHGLSEQNDSLLDDDDDDALFYARVFLVDDLHAIFEMLTTADVDQLVFFFTGSTSIPVLKYGGISLFVINTTVEREQLPVCHMCSPPQTIAKAGMDGATVERLLRNHTARHIMEGKGWEGDLIPAEPCGWCGGGECSVKITSGARKREKVQANCNRYSGFNLPSFSLSVARKKNG